MLRLVGQLCDKQMRNKKYNSIEAFMYFHKRFSTSNKELNLCQVLLLNKHILCFTSDLADKLTRFEQIFNDDHVSTSPKLPRCASAVAKSAAHLTQAAGPFSSGYSGANPRGEREFVCSV